MDHKLYIALPDGHKKGNKVGKLNKAFYSLPEATWVWHEDSEAKLKILRFLPLESDPGVFLHKSDKGIVAIDMHIHDGTGVCSSEEEELDLKADIQKFYKIK